MTILSYSELNDQQLKQVAYLFADSFFVTDPAAFVYELDIHGNVRGRAITGEQLKNKKRAVLAPVIVTATQEVNITEEIIRHTRMSMDALAASIARDVYQHQCQFEIEEVNYE